METDQPTHSLRRCVPFDWTPECYPREPSLLILLVWVTMARSNVALNTDEYDAMQNRQKHKRSKASCNRLDTRPTIGLAKTLIEV